MYSIKEAFYTIQGEGYHAGTPAVFVRFTGCNIWSGREQDRERDASKGNCARWCDTDFRGTNGEHGGRYSAEGIAALVRELWPTNGEAHVVLTGGEPLLQVDQALVDCLNHRNTVVHVETNGTVDPRIKFRFGESWITISPKPPSMIKFKNAISSFYGPDMFICDEIKLVYAPGAQPEQYEKLAPNLFLQPMWLPDLDARTRECARVVEYVKKNPKWRVSLQTHKLLGIS